MALAKEKKTNKFSGGLSSSFILYGWMGSRLGKQMARNIAKESETLVPLNAEDVNNGFEVRTNQIAICQLRELIKRHLSPSGCSTASK